MLVSDMVSIEVSTLDQKKAPVKGLRNKLIGARIGVSLDIRWHGPRPATIPGVFANSRYLRGHPGHVKAAAGSSFR